MTYKEIINKIKRNDYNCNNLQIKVIEEDLVVITKDIYVRTSTSTAIKITVASEIVLDEENFIFAVFGKMTIPDSNNSDISKSEFEKEFKDIDLKLFESLTYQNEEDYSTIYKLLFPVVSILI